MSEKSQQQITEAAQRSFQMCMDFLTREMMTALDDEVFLEQVRRCPNQYRNLLQNGWVCMILWAFYEALSHSFSDRPEMAELTLAVLIEHVISKKEWFDSSLCETIQLHVDQLMPEAWTKKGSLGTVFPVAHWLEAIARGYQEHCGQQVTWSSENLPDAFQFGIFFAHYFPRLIVELRDTVNKISTPS